MSEDNERMEERSGMSRINREGWLALAIGLGLAVAIFCYSPATSFITHYFKTLVHEIGHSLFAVIFGSPSLPAFDFRYGGGFARIKPQTTWLLVFNYALILAAFCYFCKRWKAIIALIFFTILYSVLTFSKVHVVIITFMGHGFELVIAGLFLYRALSGTAVINQLERPLYAFLGFFIIMTDTKFAYLLLTDKTERILYGFGKGGHANDFVLIAEDYLHIPLRAVAAFFLFCCIITPVLTLMFYFFRIYIYKMIVFVFGPAH